MQGSSPPPRCRGGPSPTAGDRRGGPHAHLTRGDSQGVAHALLLDPAGRLDLRVGPGAAVTGEGADDDLFEEGDPGEQEPRHPLQQRGASWEPESSGRRFPAGPVFLPRTLPAVSPSLSPARPPAPPQNTQPPLTCQQALPTPSCPPAATTTPAMAPRPLLPLTRPAGPGAGPGRGRAASPPSLTLRKQFMHSDSISAGRCSPSSALRGRKRAPPAAASTSTAPSADMLPLPPPVPTAPARRAVT